MVVDEDKYKEMEMVYCKDIIFVNQYLIINWEMNIVDKIYVKGNY